MRRDVNPIDRRCPECGSEVFQAIAGCTSKEEIDTFKLQKTMAMGPITWDPTWIPDGVYCYSCDWYDEMTDA